MKAHRFDLISFGFGTIFILFGIALALPGEVFSWLGALSSRFLLPSILVAVGVIMLLSAAGNALATRRRQREEDLLFTEEV